MVASILPIITTTVVDGFVPYFDFTFQHPGVILPPEQFLPNWWLLVLLIPASVLLIAGAVLDADRASYSTPNGLEELAEVPIYFALACAMLGLWSVLFVGLNIVQRIVLIAPIFEELLKFGVALAIGAAIFGRSMWARIGIALVIGCIFGLVEHSVTYAGEPDIIYLHRVLFHSISTMIAVAVYTSFEKRELTGLLWIAPIYPIILHYLNNAFAVASSILLTDVPEETQMFVSLVSGAVIIFLGLVLLGLAIFRHDITEVLHREPYLFLREVM